MLSLPLFAGDQIPLIHEVHSDDLTLANTVEGEWYTILHEWNWSAYREVAAAYYDALYEWNRESAAGRSSPLGTGESQEQARQRLLFERATMASGEADERPVLYEPEKKIEGESIKTDPQSLAPGIVPARLVGRKPKCFFSLLKSFLGATLMGFAAEPEVVYLLLMSNPSFARVCGFAPKGGAWAGGYHSQHVPSSRKLEQFDQVMRQAGLWDRLKRAEVSTNQDSGVIKHEDELVGDTTHYRAYSGFETVRYEDDRSQPQKKSQSKLTKACRCESHFECTHEWILADDGAGTIVKSKTKMIWGHKASIIGFPRQGAILDAVAVADAAPLDESGESVCLACLHCSHCCNTSNTLGHTITVPFQTLPHIDAQDPPMAKRFKAILQRRPSVERMIKRLKCDLGDERLSKRGNESFQATLDKTLIAYHLLLRHLH